MLFLFSALLDCFCWVENYETSPALRIWESSAVVFMRSPYVLVHGGILMDEPVLSNLLAPMD